MYWGIYISRSLLYDYPEQIPHPLRINGFFLYVSNDTRSGVALKSAAVPEG